MKLAHLILAHHQPQQLERLVKRLLHPDADIYVHIDAKADIGQFHIVANLPTVSFIQGRVPVAWGEYSVMRATLKSMEEILAKNVAYTHINLLSGNDYPLKNNGNIHQFFSAHQGETFMWFNKIFDDWVHGQVRINQYDFGDYGFPGRYQLARLMNKFMPARKMPSGLVPYGQSQWLTIVPEAALYVIEFIKVHPDVERFFRQTWAVDEVLFQTILCNSEYRNTLVNDNLRYLPLKPDFRPVVFTKDDVPALVGSGKFYARKFDLNIDSVVFDELDKLVDG